MTITRLYMHDCDETKLPEGWWLRRDLASYAEGIGGAVEVKNDNCPFCGEPLEKKVIDFA